MAVSSQPQRQIPLSDSSAEKSKEHYEMIAFCAFCTAQKIFLRVLTNLDSKITTTGYFLGTAWNYGNMKAVLLGCLTTVIILRILYFKVKSDNFLNEHIVKVLCLFPYVNTDV